MLAVKVSGLPVSASGVANFRHFRCIKRHRPNYIQVKLKTEIDQEDKLPTGDRFTLDGSVT